MYKDHVEKEGGRRRVEVRNNLDREDSSRGVNLATTNQGNGGIVQADKPNNISTGGLRPYKGRYSLLVFVYIYTCTTNLITIIYTYEFKKGINTEFDSILKRIDHGHEEVDSVRLNTKPQKKQQVMFKDGSICTEDDEDDSDLDVLKVRMKMNLLWSQLWFLNLLRKQQPT